MGDLNELVEKLNKWADVLIIPSGDFVNEDLRRTAAALTSLIAERDGLRHDVDSAGSLRLRMEAHRLGHDAARANFLTMQGAAAQLLKRAEAAEAQLKETREHIDRFCQINCQDAQAIADAQIAACQEPKS